MEMDLLEVHSNGTSLSRSFISFTLETIFSSYVENKISHMRLNSLSWPKSRAFFVVIKMVLKLLAIISVFLNIQYVRYVSSFFFHRHESLSCKIKLYKFK